MRELERVAETYDRPLALFFLPQPPDEASVATEFRRLRDAPRPPWPPEFRHLLRSVRARQEDAAELYATLDLAPPWHEVHIEWDDDPEIIASNLRGALGVGVQDQRGWRGRGGWAARRGWTDAVEDLGILVMQSGVLPIALMRGFAVPHRDVPAIVANSKDDPRSRAFTIIHETAHLINERAGAPAVALGEEFYEWVAGAVLMPANWFSSDLTRERQRKPSLMEAVDAVAYTYSVTPRAAAVRGRKLGAIGVSELIDLLAGLDDRSAGASAGESRGNYYLNTISGVGPGFIRLVFEALDAGTVTYATASAMLGVTANNFHKLRERLGDGVGVG
jgi:Zn-dependent peptidase ImmA (M78 family)